MRTSSVLKYVFDEQFRDNGIINEREDLLCVRYLGSGAHVGHAHYPFFPGPLQSPQHCAWVEAVEKRETDAGEINIPIEEFVLRFHALDMDKTPHARVLLDKNNRDWTLFVLENAHSFADDVVFPETVLQELALMIVPDTTDELGFRTEPAGRHQRRRDHASLLYLISFHITGVFPCGQFGSGDKDVVHYLA